MSIPSRPIPSLLTHISLLLFGLVAGSYLSYRWISHPIHPADDMVELIQEELEVIKKLADRELKSKVLIHEELAIIKKKKKRAAQIRLSPAEGFLAQERNQLRSILQESHYMLLNVQESMMLALLQLAKLTKITEQIWGDLNILLSRLLIIITTGIILWYNR